MAMMDDPEVLKAALKESPIFENLPGFEKYVYTHTHAHTDTDTHTCIHV
jgi:hypothetical protein